MAQACAVSAEPRWSNEKLRRVAKEAVGECPGPSRVVLPPIQLYQEKEAT